MYEYNAEIRKTLDIAADQVLSLLKDSPERSLELDVLRRRLEEATGLDIKDRLGTGGKIERVMTGEQMQEALRVSNEGEPEHKVLRRRIEAAETVSDVLDLLMI